jgi:transposase
MIEAVLERCAGIDVGKKYVVCCLSLGAANSTATEETRQYDTTVAELKKMRDWLLENQCSHVAMESTGPYWKPVFNLLEEHFTVILANAQQVKSLPGKKTDRKDGRRLAHFLRHNLIEASFIPPVAIRQLRDLTRRRRKLLGAGASERNRVQKVLEDANVKLGNVLSDVFGASGQAMLEALLSNQGTPQQLAEFARGKLRRKVPEIVTALEEHRMRDHHRFLIRQSLRHMAFLEEQVAALDEEILRQAKPFETQLANLQTIPGIKATAAASILAEVGVDMKQFPTAHHLASWAGICPGNNESAGKHKGTQTRKGDPWLRGTLTESAWAASRKKGSSFAARFRRLAPHRGQKRALVALGHNLLIVVYQVLATGQPYQELGSTYHEERNKEALVRHHLRCLRALGALAPGADLTEVRHDPAA